MRSSHRVLLCSAALAIGAFAGRVQSSPSVTTPAEAPLAGFGGAVLVGDGEVFAGEAANQFRPGMVYVYRKDGRGLAGSGDADGAECRGRRWLRHVAGAGRLDRSSSAPAPPPCTCSRSRAARGRSRSTVAVRTCRCPMPPAPPAAATPRTRSRRRSPAAAGAPAPPVARFGGDRRVGRLAARRQGSRRRRARTRRPSRLAGAAAAAPRRRSRPAPSSRSSAAPTASYAYHSTIAVRATRRRRAGDNFGSSIALTGTTALIGASGQSEPAPASCTSSDVDADGAWKSHAHVRAGRRAGQRRTFGSRDLDDRRSGGRRGARRCRRLRRRLCVPKSDAGVARARRGRRAAGWPAGRRPAAAERPPGQLQPGWK